MAFHLGCLRALNDRGILEQLTTLSTVSGGSVIGAMYAFSDDDFATFDARVVATLRRGLVGSMVSRFFSPARVLASLATTVSASALAVATDLTRLLLGRFWPRAKRLQPPLRRWHSRTTAFQAMLDSQLFRGAALTDVKRQTLHGALDVIINATELRTGTAFRFGTTVGSRRHGTLQGATTPVSLAVAASAAYPALLPALDREFPFSVGKDTVRRRVLLSDGGIYDNLGTAPMEPGRDRTISTHVARPDYIVACDAGVGVVDGRSIPYWWPTRMTAAFETAFRRVQNDTRNRLHRHRAEGRIQGFVMPYLGQDDSRLPWKPTDLIPRSAVVDYPTDFSPMSDESIELLAGRGEQLTRILIAHYMSEV